MNDAYAWTASASYARAISDPTAHLVLHTDSGESLVLDAAKFSAPPDAVDKAVLDRCQGPTLDLGCGPGRLVAELAARGVPALGVDVAPFALLLSRASGASALRRSVFDRLPGAGRWPHALLMDGNIGIGGDPGALLDRLRTLIRPRTGELIVETDAEDVDLRYRVRFGRVEGAGDEEFGWARIGAEALMALATPSGYAARHLWKADGRRFVALNYLG